MKKNDYYILGLALTNIYFFVKCASMVTTSTMSSILEYSSTLGHLVFVLFLISIVIIFNNISRLVALVGVSKENDERKALSKVGSHTVLVLALYAILVLSDTYIVYSLYGGY